MAEGGKQELENRKEEREKGKDRGPRLNIGNRLVELGKNLTPVR